MIKPLLHQRKLYLILVLSGLGLAFLGGWFAVVRGFSYREWITFGGLLAVVALVLAGERGVYFALLFGVAALGLGYRTVALTRYIRIHPAELFIWIGFFLLLWQRHQQRRPLAPRLPRWLWISLPFWIWAWLPGLVAGRSWELMLAEFRNFLILFPLFIVVDHLSREGMWHSLVLSFYAMGTYVALFGAVEYLFPAITTLMPSFFAVPDASIEIGGFLRARFSFWGTPAASFILVLTAPLALILWRRFRQSPARMIIFISFFLQLFGVYIGGYRSIWLVLSVQLVLGATLLYGLFFGSLLLLPLFLAVRSYSEVALFRFRSLLLALEGAPVDTSAVKRADRAWEALQTVQQQPWGIGWSGSGWTHSDFVQIAANQGILAVVVFMVAYLYTIYRLGRHVLLARADRERKTAAIALLLSFIAVGGLLASQGVQVLPQLVLPVWFTWVLAENWLRWSSHSRGNVTT